MRRRLVSLVPLTAAAVLGLAACGSSSSTTAPATTGGAGSSSSSSSSSSAAGTGLDSCLVGAFKASGTMSTQTIGTSPVTFTGGAGETLVIQADGSFTDDYANAGPVTGTGGGHTYTVTTTGTSTGKATTAGGKVTIVIDDPTRISQLTAVDGVAQGAPSNPSKSTTLDYACQSGGFTVSQTGTVTTYEKA